jgi:hypothetical protein
LNRERVELLRHPLFAVALLLLSAGLALAAPAGAVVGLFGACFVDSGGSRSAAKIGQPVQVGDTIEVPADGKMKLRMADGSVISVAASTRMTIDAYGVDSAGLRQDGRLSLAQGLLRAVVAPVERPASFEIDTAVGTAAVRSTDWFVEVSQCDAGRRADRQRQYDECCYRPQRDNPGTLGRAAACSHQHPQPAVVVNDLMLSLTT